VVDELNVELVDDLVPDDSRAGDAAWAGQPFKARRQIDAVAIEIFAVDDDVAERDPYPELDLSVFGRSDISTCHPPLNFGRTSHSVDDASKLDQKTVTHRFEDSSVEPFDSRVEELPPMQFECTERMFFVSMSRL
jgi:hypothetical protein